MSLHRLSSACAVAMMMLLMALPAKAAPEVQANTFVLGAQEEPAIAKLTNGYIVVWASAGQDGSGYGIYGQRYTENGAKIGAELHISETTAGDQLKPRVAGLADGGFVVVWKGSSLRRFLYIRDGIPERTDSSVAAKSELARRRAPIGLHVAALTNGGFVVIWDPQFGQPSQAGITWADSTIHERGRSAMTSWSYAIKNAYNPGLPLRRLLTEVSSRCGSVTHDLFAQRVRFPPGVWVGGHHSK